MNWCCYETVSIIIGLATKAQHHLRLPCKVQIATWLRYRAFMVFTHERELMLIWNSLDNNQIDDQGATSLASALYNPHCNVTMISWVYRYPRTRVNWDANMKQPRSKSNWRPGRDVTCKCTTESKLQSGFDSVGLCSSNIDAQNWYETVSVIIELDVKAQSQL